MFIQVEHLHSYQDLWVAKTTEENGVGLGCSSCEEGAQWGTEGRAKHMPMTAEHYNSKILQLCSWLTPDHHVPSPDVSLSRLLHAFQRFTTVVGRLRAQ